jgi:hypothetical protein
MKITDSSIEHLSVTFDLQYLILGCADGGVYICKLNTHFGEDILLE